MTSHPDRRATGTTESVIAKKPGRARAALTPGAGRDCWWVYIVRCADRSLYTGIAKDCAARLTEHNAGRGAKYTRSRRPVELVYAEPAADRSSALQREREIKEWPRHRKIELCDT